MAGRCTRRSPSVRRASTIRPRSPRSWPDRGIKARSSTIPRPPLPSDGLWNVVMKARDDARPPSHYALKSGSVATSGCHYRDAEVDVVTRIRAAKALADATEDLRLDDVRLRFVLPADSVSATLTIDRDVSSAVGWAQTQSGGRLKTVVLRADRVDETNVVATVGHECRHLWHGPEFAPADSAIERNCAAWAGAFQADYKREVDKMTQKTNTDWRADPQYTAARVEVETIERQVNKAESSTRVMLRQIRELEAFEAQASSDLADGKATLPDLIDARRKLADARAQVDKLATDSAPMYQTYAAARQRLAAAEVVARSQAWPAGFAEYLSATDQLAAALEAAVAAEARVIEVHQRLGLSFGTRDGWVLGGDGVPVGSTAWGRRRVLTPEQFADWRRWRIEANVINEGERRRAEAARLMKESEALEKQLEREGKLQSEAAEFRRANSWFSTRQLSPSGLVSVRMKGVGETKPKPGNSA